MFPSHDRVGSIPNANTLELCNEGEGAPTGQLIEADANCDGIPEVQIFVVSSDDPCVRDGVQAGVLLVCDEGVRKPLEGTVDGQVPVWNAFDEKFDLVNSNIIEQCTALAACLTLDIGDVGPYVITVVSTSLFQAGITIVIGEGDDEITATIDEVINDTQLRITLTDAPTEIVTYDPPTRVCIQDCCAEFPDLVERVTTNETNIETLQDIINDPCYPQQLLQIVTGKQSL